VILIFLWGGLMEVRNESKIIRYYQPIHITKRLRRHKPRHSLPGTGKENSCRFGSKHHPGKGQQRCFYHFSILLVS
jgi:hypothetical protein